MFSFQGQSSRSIWGDGLQEDDFADFVRVRSFDQLCSDELIRVYPRLQRNGEVAQRVLDHLQQCVAVLYHRIVSRDGNCDVRLLSMTAKVASALGRRWEAVWFEPPLRMKGLRGDAQGNGSTPAVRRNILALLDQTLVQVQSRRSDDYDSGIASTIAYHAGLHPVYLWPEALCCHELYTTLGWLGIVRRGRAAHLPRDIRAFLIQTISFDEEDRLCVDPELAPFLGSADMARTIWAEATKSDVDAWEAVDLSALRLNVPRASSSRFP